MYDFFFFWDIKSQWASILASIQGVSLSLSLLTINTIIITSKI